MSYGLRYYFDFYADRDTRIIGGTSDLWTTEIYDLNYVGSATEVQAVQFPVQINYPNVQDNKLQSFRGSFSDVTLLETDSFSLLSLYTENERRWLIKHKRNGTVEHVSFIIPDGCQQSFTFKPFPISINTVDGLGLLKNLSFVQNDGNFWLGKMSVFEVIYNCLNRLGIPDMNINTCVNIYEVSMSQGDNFDPLVMTYVNAERYLKDDGINPLNCQEVLNAILQEWTACIIQSEGQWWIFRPNESGLNGTLVFRRYVNGVVPYDTVTVSKNMDVLLGGESEGVALAHLFHINTDQIKMIDKPYKNAAMSYKYGFLNSILDNPNFLGWTGTAFPDWAKSLAALPLSEDATHGGAKLGKPPIVAPLAYLYSITGGIGVFGDVVEINVPYYNYRSDGPLIEVVLTDGITTYYISAAGAWSTTQTYVDVPAGLYEPGAIYILADSLPLTGTLTLRLYEARNNIVGAGADLFITYIRADISPFAEQGAPIGEIHTATQTGDYSFVPEIINVFNGDSVSASSLGAFFRENQTTVTTKWNRRGLSETILSLPFENEKDFIRIAVEEITRLYGSPFVIFEGSIFGWFNPLSRFTINLVDGRFIPVGLSYDLQANICKAVLGTVSNTEIAMNYTLEPDYGEITNITVGGRP